VKAFAQFVMRGPAQAALVIAAFGLLSLILPLFGLISSAAVGLVTLRDGARRGAVAVAVATLASAAIAAVAFGAPLVAIVLLLMLWLPILGLGALLRQSRSLALTVQAAGLLGVLVVLLLRSLVDDPAAAWLALLRPIEAMLVQDQVATPEVVGAMIGEVARWMTGAFAAGLVLQWLASLFIGRWWQAMLYNPGGFGDELRSLRLSRWVGLAGLMLLVIIGFRHGPGLGADLLVVLSVLWLLQGLAVLHALHHDRRLAVGWLIGLYVLMVLFMPHAELLVACVGFVDIWVDIRTRMSTRPTAPRG